MCACSWLHGLCRPAYNGFRQDGSRWQFTMSATGPSSLHRAVAAAAYRAAGVPRYEAAEQATIEASPASVGAEQNGRARSAGRWQPRGA